MIQICQGTQHNVPIALSVRIVPSNLQLYIWKMVTDFKKSIRNL